MAGASTGASPTLAPPRPVRAAPVARVARADAAFRDDAWLMVLDAFWPLSMLGMFIIGVKIAFAGRWTGLARVWPAVAESWAVVTVPSMVILGAGAAQVVGAGHLLVGYVTLGLIIALRPHLTGARD